MNLKILERRRKMLKAVVRREPLYSIIHQLAQEYNISERALYNDWSRRKKWLPKLWALMNLGDFGEELKTEFYKVMSAAWEVYRETKYSSAKIGALRTIMECRVLLSDAHQLYGRKSEAKEIVFKNPFWLMT